MMQVGEWAHWAGLTSYQRRLLQGFQPDGVGRSRVEAWNKDVADCLRPLRHVADVDVLAAMRFASQRLWKGAA